MGTEKDKNPFPLLYSFIILLGDRSVWSAENPVKRITAKTRMNSIRVLDLMVIGLLFCIRRSGRKKITRKNENIYGSGKKNLLTGLCGLQ
jgi:hypothetical protein